MNKQLEEAFQYIESHPEIRDIVLSGGDPLSLSDKKLDMILTRIRSIPPYRDFQNWYPQFGNTSTESNS